MDEVLVAAAAEGEYTASLTWNAARNPFEIIYRNIVDGKWLVVAVAHTSRQPRYWVNR